MKSVHVLLVKRKFVEKCVKQTSEKVLENPANYPSALFSGMWAGKPWIIGDILNPRTSSSNATFRNVFRIKFFFNQSGKNWFLGILHGNLHVICTRFQRNMRAFTAVTEHLIFLFEKCRKRQESCWEKLSHASFVIHARIRLLARATHSNASEYLREHRAMRSYSFSFVTHQAWLHIRCTSLFFRKGNTFYIDYNFKGYCGQLICWLKR